MRITDSLFSVPRDSFSARACSALQELVEKTESVFQKYFIIPLAAFCLFLTLPLIDCMRRVYLLSTDSNAKDTLWICLQDLASHIVSLIIAPFRLLAHWTTLYNPLFAAVRPLEGTGLLTLNVESVPTAPGKNGVPLSLAAPPAWLQASSVEHFGSKPLISEQFTIPPEVFNDFSEAFGWDTDLTRRKAAIRACFKAVEEEGLYRGSRIKDAILSAVTFFIREAMKGDLNCIPTLRDLRDSMKNYCYFFIRDHYLKQWREIVFPILENQCPNLPQRAAIEFILTQSAPEFEIYVLQYAQELQSAYLLDFLKDSAMWKEYKPGLSEYFCSLIMGFKEEEQIKALEIICEQVAGLSPEGQKKFFLNRSRDEKLPLSLLEYVLFYNKRELIKLLQSNEHFQSVLNEVIQVWEMGPLELEKEFVFPKDLRKIYDRALALANQGKIEDAKGLLWYLQMQVKSMSIDEFMAYVQTFFPCLPVLTNCQQLAEVKEIFVGEIHGYKDNEEGRRFILWCLSSPHDLVLLEGFKAGVEIQDVNLFHNCPLSPPLLKYIGWDDDIRESLKIFLTLYLSVGRLLQKVLSSDFNAYGFKQFLDDCAQSADLSKYGVKFESSFPPKQHQLFLEIVRLYKNTGPDLGHFVNEAWKGRQEKLVEVLSSHAQQRCRKFVIAGRHHVMQENASNTPESILNLHLQKCSQYLIIGACSKSREDRVNEELIDYIKDFENLPLFLDISAILAGIRIKIKQGIQKFSSLMDEGARKEVEDAI